MSELRSKNGGRQMTRWEKWLAQQDYGTRANMICGTSLCSECPIHKPCTETHYDGTEEKLEEWNKACEEYLDEEVGE